MQTSLTIDTAPRAGHRPAEGRRRFDRDGVTLIETVLAVIILSVAMVATSMVIGPNFLSSTASRNTTADALGLLRMARNEAIMRQTSVDMELQSVRGGQQIVMTVQPSASQPGSRVQWPVDANTRISAQPSRVRFLPTGSADSGLEWAVVSGGNRRVVTMEAAVGMATDQASPIRWSPPPTPRLPTLP